MADFYELPPINADDAPVGSRDYQTIQWCESRLSSGVKFIESQIGYDKIAITLDAVFSNEKLMAASYIPGNNPLSQTRANQLPGIAEDLTAMLTDVRMFWKYSTANKKYEKQTDLSNKIAEDWYSTRMIDLRIGDVVKYYTFGGTGFAHLYYSRRIDDMMLEAEDPRNVFPIDPISTHTLDDCKGVIIRKARTPEWVREEFNKVVPAETGGLGLSSGG